MKLSFLDQNGTEHLHFMKITSSKALGELGVANLGHRLSIMSKVNENLRDTSYASSSSTPIGNSTFLPCDEDNFDFTREEIPDLNTSIEKDTNVASDV